MPKRRRQANSPRVLVALFGETRATELTGDSFRANVLDALGADLALCVRAGEEPNRFHEWAEHIWTVEEPEGDFAPMYDEAAGNSDWRVLLELGPNLFGRIESTEHPQIGAVALLHYYRWRLWQMLEREGLPARYEWIVLSRSDFLWPVPHPDVSLLSDRRIHALDGEAWGGVCDKHFVVPKRYFEPMVRDLAGPVFTAPVELKRSIDAISRRWGWEEVNNERLLAARLLDLGLWRRVSYLPHYPYTVRAPGGSTSWSVGEYDPELGYYVKYPTERTRSEIALELLPDEHARRAYHAPLRGLPLRRRLRRAYRERGLDDRSFTRREGAARRLRHARMEAARRRLAAETGAGRVLRRIPGAPAVLDARLRRNQR
jgi:hypothetical protein